MKKTIVLAASILLASTSLTYAKTVRALFIGNSYTASNDLPGLIQELARTTNDTLVYESVTPGGYRFQQHATLSETISKIEAGNWDYVILQEQSQLPSFGDAQVATQVYPYARALDSMVKASNPCATTLFYMTWGRKNGDASNCPYLPALCTYEGMDNLLQLRYTIMAEDNQAAIAPVARVWRSLRNEHPSIELYTPDESHPSMAGSYAAACTFYSLMFKKDPTTTTYLAGLPATTAATIQSVASNIVFDSIAHWNRYEPDYLQAEYSSSITDMSVSFTNASINATHYHWDFGDGNTSTLENPIHAYEFHGTYDVQLTAYQGDCERGETFSTQIEIASTSIHTPVSNNHTLIIAPNPAIQQISIHFPSGLSQIKIVDLLGRAVIQTIQFANPTSKTTIDISKLPSGQYFVIGNNDKLGVVTQAFMKY